MQTKLEGISLFVSYLVYFSVQSYRDMEHLREFFDQLRNIGIVNVADGSVSPEFGPESGLQIGPSGII